MAVDWPTRRSFDPRCAAVQLQPKLLRVHYLAQRFEPALVAIRSEQDIVRAIAGGIHDFSRTELVAHDNVAAIGLRKFDSQLRPVGVGKRFEGE